MRKLALDLSVHGSGHWRAAVAIHRRFAMAGTAESSREVLVAGLDGWKAGKSFEEPNSGSFAVQFVDDDLNGGVKLLDYRSKARGRAARDRLSLRRHIENPGQGWQAREGKVAYIAVSEPKPAITREDRKP